MCALFTNRIIQSPDRQSIITLKRFAHKLHTQWMYSHAVECSADLWVISIPSMDVRNELNAIRSPFFAGGVCFCFFISMFKFYYSWIKWIDHKYVLIFKLTIAASIFIVICGSVVESDFWAAHLRPSIIRPCTIIILYTHTHTHHRQYGVAVLLSNDLKRSCFLSRKRSTRIVFVISALRGMRWRGCIAKWTLSTIIYWAQKRCNFVWLRATESYSVSIEHLLSLMVTVALCGFRILPSFYNIHVLFCVFFSSTSRYYMEVLCDNLR